SGSNCKRSPCGSRGVVLVSTRRRRMRVLGGGGGVVYPLDVTTFNQSVSGTNLVTNGDMESGSPPTGWSAGTDSTVAADADAHSGSQSLLVTRNGAQTTNFAFRSISTTEGKWYLCDG